MPQAHIVGTGSSMPKRILSNEDLESMVDTSDEWITRRSGIKERRISSNLERESTCDLSTRASSMALEMAGMEPKDLDMIVVGTVTADRQFPSAACMIQMSLDANNAMAFDISAGWSGFLYALTVVNNAIRCGTCRNALVVGVDRLSSVVNWQDRGTCVLLADGAGAVAVSSKPEKGGVLSTHLRSDGRLWELLYSEEGNTFKPDILHDIDQKSFYLKMDGKGLFKQAIGCMSEISRDALRQNALTVNDLDLVVPHQANSRIINALANTLSIPVEKVYVNIHKYGNTSSATIPIALDEANREGRLKKGDNVLMVTFGAGLTWGACIVEWTA